MMRLYGIANCDTVKKARGYLAQHAVAYEFHDFKKLGVPHQHLAAWVAAAGWERVLNRHGNTWRQLDESARQAVVDGQTASALMLAYPASSSGRWSSGPTGPSAWASIRVIGQLGCEAAGLAPANLQSRRSNPALAIAMPFTRMSTSWRPA